MRKQLIAGLVMAAVVWTSSCVVPVTGATVSRSGTATPAETGTSVVGPHTIEVDGDDGIAAPAATDTVATCPREPYPCGGEWPAELVGRDDFALDRIEEVRVVADDGITLHGWIAHPRVP